MNAPSFVGRFRHRDTMTTRINEFGPDNPEPLTDDQILRMSTDQFRQWKETGRKPAMDDDPEFEPVADTSCNAAHQFALNSDRKNGIDSGRPTESELAKMSPIERFQATSDARNRIGHRPGRAEDIRRRRSE